MNQALYNNLVTQYSYIVDEISEIRDSEPWEINVIGKDGSIHSYWLGDQTLRRISMDGKLSDSDYSRELGIKITHIMWRKGISQLDLAEKLNTTQATISRYLSGKTNLNICQLRKIANALDTPLDTLMLKF